MNGNEIGSFLHSACIYWSTNCTRVGALCQTTEGKQPGRKIYQSKGVGREMSWRVPTCRASQQGGKARPPGRVTTVSSVNRPAHHRISSKGSSRNNSQQSKILVRPRARHQAKPIRRRSPYITLSVSHTWILGWRIFEGRAWVCSCESHSEEDNQDPSQSPSHTQVSLGLHFLQLRCVSCMMGSRHTLVKKIDESPSTWSWNSRGGEK